MSVKSDMVIIMRRPCVMEDAGRHEFIMRTTRAEAENWIQAQENEYFKPEDYYIAEETKCQITK
jgi:hypothetical protein